MENKLSSREERLNVQYIVFLFECSASVLQENPDLWEWLTASAQEQPPEAVEINPVSYDQEMKVQFSYFPCFSYVLEFHSSSQNIQCCRCLLPCTTRL